MRTVIDTEGRLVLPPELLNKAGLKPGLPVVVELAEGGVSVKAVTLDQPVEIRDTDASDTHLIEKDGMLVFTGEWVGTEDDAVNFVRKMREEHSDRQMGL